jgi:hypothetical protein
MMLARAPIISFCGPLADNMRESDVAELHAFQEDLARVCRELGFAAYLPLTEDYRDAEMRRSVAADCCLMLATPDRFTEQGLGLEMELVQQRAKPIWLLFRGGANRAHFPYSRRNFGLELAYSGLTEAENVLRPKLEMFRTDLLRKKPDILSYNTGEVRKTRRMSGLIDI